MTELDARTRLKLAWRSASWRPDVDRVYRAAVEVISELDAEVMRLKDELAEVQGQPVIHATGAQCEQIISSGSMDGETFGTLLRSTDDGRTWERTGVGWQLQ